jgi:nucleotide-binding universal stress UspA family protein
MKAAVAISHRVQLKNIIFATDFSPAATAAMPLAAQLAKSFGAKLFAVHAKTPEIYALPTTEVWPAANAALEENTAELRRTLYNRFPGVDFEVLIGEGGVWGVIEGVAREKEADLIVVGTSGRRGIGKFILGSVAEEILRRANCPVLTVGPYSPSEPPREAKFKKIVYATNFGEGSPAAAAYAVALAQEYQAHLTLLHVIEHPKTGELVRPHELEAAALEHLRRLVPQDAELWCEPKVVVLHGSPAERILETAANENADLIVMGLREAKGLVRATHLPAAVAHQVVSHAACPVLTVRA